jgi:hypothetical protein
MEKQRSIDSDAGTKKRSEFGVRTFEAVKEWDGMGYGAVHRL